MMNVDQDLEKRELLGTAGRNVKWYTTMENSMEGLL